MFSTIEELIREQLAEQSVPAFSMAVLQGQEITYAKGFGVTSREEGGVPVSVNTLFRIGSLSKPLTATAIMILVDQGKIELDVPIKEYVPYFKLLDQEAADKITLRMLLSHTAGLPDGTEIIGKRDLDALDYYIRNDVPKLSIVAPPGLIFSYSNHHLNIAGYVAEVVYGKYFPELMKEVLFDPLGMTRTVYDPLQAMTFPVALAHERTENGGKVVRPFYENASNYPSWFGMSTVEDYAKFLIMHMNKGIFEDQTILSPSAINEMHRSQVSRYNLHQLGCGLSFITEEYSGVSTIRHGGAIGTYTSFMLAAPERRLAVVTMSSQDYGIDLAYEVMDKLLEEVKPISPQLKVMPPNDLVWNRYVGYYLGSLNGLSHIYIDHQQLKIDLNGTEMTLHAFKEDVYFAKDSEGNTLVTVGFVLDGEEQKQINYVVVDGAFCKRVGQEVVSLPMADWAPLEGDYYNGAITIGLKVIKDQLFLLDEDKKLFCKQLFGNFFYTEEHGLLEIKEIENKRIMVIQDNWKFEKVVS